MLKKICMYLGVALTLSVCSGCAGSAKSGDGLDLPQLSDPSEGEDIAVMETNMGVIKLRFFPKYAPKAVENFITHAKDGYYDGVIFHRVIKDFMIQGGDPDGTGMGGESIWGGTFEYETTPSLRHFRGALAMAHSSLPDSNGSQFYIVQNSSISDYWQKNYNQYLNMQDEVGTSEDGKKIKLKEIYPTELLNKYLTDGGTPDLDFGYTVFGQVIEGLDVVDKIAGVTTNRDDKPLDDVVINSIVIEQYNK